MDVDKNKNKLLNIIILAEMSTHEFILKLIFIIIVLSPFDLEFVFCL